MNGFFLKNLPDRECLEKMADRYPQMNADAAEIYLHLMRLGTDVGVRVSDYLSQYNLSTGRMSILMMLNAQEEEPSKPGELAERCGVTPATVTRLVESLIKDGYVERIPDPENRRINPVRMTQSGRVYLEALLPGYFSEITEDFSLLSAEERQTFLSVLIKLQNHLNKTNEEK